jgi:hypothetical protein
MKAKGRIYTGIKNFLDFLNLDAKKVKDSETRV